MKKHIFAVITFAVLAVSASASQFGELAVKVPFAFKAGDATLPAGTYKVTEAGLGYVLIRGDKGGVFVPRSAMLLDLDDSGKASFKFNKTGDGYVLKAVHSEK